jgi:hypothetical protein
VQQVQVCAPAIRSGSSEAYPVRAPPSGGEAAPGDGLYHLLMSHLFVGQGLVSLYGRLSFKIYLD